MRVIVDASIFGLVILRQGVADEIERIQEFLATAELVQPAHWPLELTSLAVRGSREKRLPSNVRTSIRDELRNLIDSADVDGRLPAAAVFDLAIEHHLSVYDAAYLELALRRELPLMTGDGPLGRAARRAGVGCIERT